MKNMAIKKPQTIPGVPAYPIPLSFWSDSLWLASTFGSHIVKRRGNTGKKTQNSEADAEC